jgi:hypothetical protein
MACLERRRWEGLRRTTEVEERDRSGGEEEEVEERKRWWIKR